MKKDPLAIILFYLLFLSIAEVLTTLVEPILGLFLYGLALAGLILHAGLSRRKAQSHFLFALAMVPLIRLLSLMTPLSHFPQVDWYLVVGAPLFLAVYLAQRLTHIKRDRLGLTIHKWGWQLLFGLSGIGLGYLEYKILHPQPLSDGLTLRQVWLPALILLIFTGFLEELIFRGMIQSNALRFLGQPGLWFVAIIFTILHLGYHSALDLAFVFGVAVCFGWFTQRSGSILGVSLAHGLTNVGMFLVFPFLLTIPKVQLPALPIIAATPQIRATISQPTLAATIVELPTATLTSTPIPTNPPTATPQPTATPTNTFTPTAAPTSLPSPTPRPTKTAMAPTDPPTATSAPPTSTAVSCQLPTGWFPYTVRYGDTLWRLSKDYHINLNELYQVNCMKPGDILYAGQTLYLPKFP